MGGGGKCCDHCLCKCNNYLLGYDPSQHSSGSHPPGSSHGGNYPGASGSSFKSYHPLGHFDHLNQISPSPRNSAPGRLSHSTAAPTSQFDRDLDRTTRSPLSPFTDQPSLSPPASEVRSLNSLSLSESGSGSADAGSEESESITMGRKRKNKKTEKGSKSNKKASAAPAKGSKSRSKKRGSPPPSSSLPSGGGASGGGGGGSAAVSGSTPRTADLMASELNLLRQKVQVCELRSAIMDEKLRELNTRVVPKERLVELRQTIIGSINQAFDQVLRETHRVE